MLTLTQHPDNQEIGTLIEGSHRQPIYFHPKKNPDLKIQVDDISGFNTQEFRDRFSITKIQANEIMQHITSDTEPEGALQGIFFKVKSFINNSLYVEMDLRTSEQRIEVNFPEGSDTWGELAICAGASGSGKTHFIASKVARNLDGKKKNRRHFIWLSAEYNKDKTLKILKKDKYRFFFTGVDIGEQAFAMSQHTTRKEFFEQEVKALVDSASSGTVVICDDPMDSAIADYLRPYISGLLRTARHDGIGLMYIVHSIRSGSWSSQAHNSVKYFILFPRSQRGKIRSYLNTEIGLTLREARENVQDFGDASRVMLVRIHSPQALISDKLIRLI